MKLKDAVVLLGFKPNPKRYEFEIRTFDLGKFGLIQYAQWLHPNERKKIFTERMVEQFTSFLQPGESVIDIGAHTGDSTIPLSLAVGRTGKVLAFEPNPYVFEILQKNCELNKESMQIVPLQFAATSADDEYEFEYSDAGYCNGGLHEGISRWRHGHLFKLKVQGRNLCSLLTAKYPDVLRKLKLIKVDTEGYDYQVLLSLSRIIDEKRPYLQAEVFKRTTRQQRLMLIHFLSEKGYRVHRITDPSNYLGELINEQNIANWRHFDIFCVPNTCEEQSTKLDV